MYETTSCCEKIKICLASSYKWCASGIGPGTNEIERWIDSSVLKFADGTEIFRTIKSKENIEILPQDLNKVSEWSKAWQMQFYQDKCHIITIGNKKQIAINYTLWQQRITSSESERGLRVIVSMQSNLNWDEHVGKAVKKASQVLGLILRAYENKSRNNLIWLHKSLVQLHME